MATIPLFLILYTINQSHYLSYCVWVPHHAMRIDYRRVLWGHFLPFYIGSRIRLGLSGFHSKGLYPLSHMLSFFLFSCSLPSPLPILSFPLPLSSFPILFKDGIDDLMLYRLFSNSWISVILLPQPPPECTRVNCGWKDRSTLWWSRRDQQGKSSFIFKTRI